MGWTPKVGRPVPGAQGPTDELSRVGVSARPLVPGRRRPHDQPECPSESDPTCPGSSEDPTVGHIQCRFGGGVQRSGGWRDPPPPPPGPHVLNREMPGPHRPREGVTSEATAEGTSPTSPFEEQDRTSRVSPHPQARHGRKKPAGTPLGPAPLAVDLESEFIPFSPSFPLPSEGLVTHAAENCWGWGPSERFTRLPGSLG